MSTRQGANRKKRVNQEVFEGLTLNRTGEYVKVDDELVKRLAVHQNSEENGGFENPRGPVGSPPTNPFREYPKFLEICQTGALTLDQLFQFRENLNSDSASTKMAEMIGNIPIDWLALKRSKMADNNWEYNITLPVNARVADQQHSGRCWLFAALGQMRLGLIQKFHLDPRFEFSEAYLFFYDKIERSNVFLETAWTLRTEDLNSRDWVSMTQHAHWMSDGGYYNFFANLVQKYGIVPKNVYDEGWNSNCTDGMNRILTELLNHWALEIHQSNWSREEFQECKTEWMNTIYGLMVKFLGEPPNPETVFNWHYRDVEGRSHVIKNLNPVKFLNTVVDPHLESKVLIINDPRHPETYGMCSFYPFSVNTVGGFPGSMINLPLDEFKSAICESLRAEESVWFAADIGHCFIPENNTADPDRFDYESVLDVTCEWNKADMLNARTSSPNHALLFIGVDVDEDLDGNVIKTKKWRVENSWGMMNLLEDDPDQGYCRFSDSYVDKYVTQAVVDTKFLSPAVLEQLMENTQAGKSFTYDPYDVFGTVAMRSPCTHCSKKQPIKRR